MHYLRISLISVCGLIWAYTAQAAEIKVISQASTSWDGVVLQYPTGQAELSVVRLTFAPGEVMEFHCHPVPSAGYILSGDLEVFLKDGTSKQFHAGDAITEVVNRLHHGTNLSKSKPVELIGFYAGAAGTPITIHDKEATGGCQR